MSDPVDRLLDVLTAIALLAGTSLTLVAGIGVLRLPNLLTRMHAGTKPQVLGVLLVLLAMALRLRSVGAVSVLLLVAVFQMLTAPIGAHLVGRAGYRTGKVDSASLVVDELTRDLDAARREDTDPVAGEAGRDVSEPAPDAATRDASGEARR